MLFKIIVISFLILIAGSLGSALLFLYKDRGQADQRTVKALTLRISLSIFLFVLLMAGLYFGYITPNRTQ